jgi:hypothetical protein
MVGKASSGTPERDRTATTGRERVRESKGTGGTGYGLETEIERGTGCWKAKEI